MISGTDSGHAGASLLNNARGFVTRDDRRSHDRRTREEIRVADADADDSDQNVSRAGWVERHVLKREWEIGAPKYRRRDGDAVLVVRSAHGPSIDRTTGQRP